MSPHEKFPVREEWLELVSDLQEPIRTGSLQAGLHMRWAEKRDLFTINALQGFVKETDFMEASLRKGIAASCWRTKNAYVPLPG